MNQLEKRCLIEVLKSRYRRARKKEKGEIITKLSERIGVGRKQSQRLLSNHDVGRPRNPLQRGRRSKYRDAEFVSALKLVWRITKYMCARHLHSAMKEWLPAIEAERGAFPDSVHDRLLSISAATIDRILRPYKVTKGKSLPRSGGFRDEIPIQESCWDIKVPGYLEADTVAHCGGSMLGEFVNTLTMVDIATIWTEARAVFGRGATPIVHAIEDIEKALPFAIIGYDCDNGTEVLNQHVLRYFRDERIERNKPEVKVTRSREYRKNDNAHVEQRNNSVARRWLGYERLDFTELVPLINYYYSQVVCPLMNHFYPCFKLQNKIRIKSRTRRVYAIPVTPYARVMNSPHVSKQEKEKLTAIHRLLNPVHLSQLESKLRKKIDDELKRLRAGKGIQNFAVI